MHIYLRVNQGVIADARYLCTCDPTANVVVEILCNLLKGQTIQEAGALTEESFKKALGGGGEEEFLQKSRGIIELLHRGLMRYSQGSTDLSQNPKI